MKYFRAEILPDNTVRLSWETEREINHAAFHLGRGDSSEGPFAPLGDPIPAQGGPDSGALYEYIDADVAAGEVYWYVLVEENGQGVRRVAHEPIAVAIPAPTATPTATLAATPTPTPTATTAPTATPTPTATATTSPTATATPTFTVSPSPTPSPSPTSSPTSTPELSPTPTPTPPACTERTYHHVQPPTVLDWWHEPDFPTVVGQDPTFRGFDLHVQAQGGFAETRQVTLERVCPDGSTDPAACPQAWRWQCRERVLAHYDDPIVAIALTMELAPSAQGWLQGDLARRYYHARPQEGLPRRFPLWQGRAMAVETTLRKYKALDPGLHVGEIRVTTQGTPLNPPQEIAEPYRVPVYLLDSTMDE